MQLKEINNEVGVLWEHQNKEGVVYFTGKLHTESGDVLITTVKIRAGSEASPDYFIALSKIKS